MVRAANDGVNAGGSLFPLVPAKAGTQSLQRKDLDFRLRVNERSLAIVITRLTEIASSRIALLATKKRRLRQPPFSKSCESYQRACGAGAACAVAPFGAVPFAAVAAGGLPGSTMILVPTFTRV
jgi:hypothetical protein